MKFTVTYNFDREIRKLWLENYHPFLKAAGDNDTFDTTKLNITPIPHSHRYSSKQSGIFAIS